MRSVVLMLVCIAMVCSHKVNQGKIPNGNRVLNPCDNTIWAGVGHWNPQGTGLLNPFGEDFRTIALHHWNPDFCKRDSDGDGVSNGAELGDPNCLWTPNNNHQLQNPTGHPGICEPVGASRCAPHIFSC